MPSIGPTNALRPEKIVLQAGTASTAPRGAAAAPRLRAGRRGGPARELVLEAGEGHANLDIGSFEALGVDPPVTYSGRFRGRGEAGEVSSAPFVFSPCRQWLRAFPAISLGSADPKWFVIVQVGLDTAVAEVRAGLTLEPIRGVATPLGTLDFLPLDEGTARRRFDLPLGGGRQAAFYAQLPDVKIDCANRLRVAVRVKDAAGETYPSAKVESACQGPAFRLPRECRFGLALYQQFQGCSASPDVVYASAGGYADRPARVTIEGGPPESPVVLDTFDFVSTPEKPDFVRSYEVSVEGHGGETYPIRGLRRPPRPRVPARRRGVHLRHRRPVPARRHVPPASRGRLRVPRPGRCRAAPRDARPRRRRLAPRRAERPWRGDGGAWKPLRRLDCDAACQKDPTVPTGRPFALDWDAGGLDSGWYELQMGVCDRSGNQGSTAPGPRHPRVPDLQIVERAEPRLLPERRRAGRGHAGDGAPGAGGEPLGERARRGPRGAGGPHAVDGGPPDRGRRLRLVGWPQGRRRSGAGRGVLGRVLPGRRVRRGRREVRPGRGRHGPRPKSRSPSPRVASG